MSFILDALKKSESDRQRQSEPALYEVRVARPVRSGLPPWAIAIVALLGVNLAIIGWLLVHRESKAAPPAGAPPAAQSAPPPQTSAPAYAQPQPAPMQPYYPYPPQPQAYQPQPYPPQGYAQPMAPNPGMAAYPQQAQPGYPPPYPQQPVANTQPAPAPAPQSNGYTAEAGGNPDDYAPAVEAPNPPAEGHVRRGTELGLPLYPDPEAAAAAGMPRLHMDFHVYGASPQQRFVMINTHSLHEGQTSPEGVRVETITPDGAAISQGTAKYFLPRP